jgi:MFS family permease
MSARLKSTLDRFFDVPVEAGLDPEISRHYRHNFVFNVLDQAHWLFGTSFISLTAILPVYASHLTSSPFLIGLIPALNDAGWFLPQIFLAPYTERQPRKLPLVRMLGFWERVPYLILPLGVLWLNGLSSQWAIAVFILLMAWKSIGAGIVAIPWQELMAKIIPVARRGRFFGTANFVGQSLGILGSAVALALLGWLPYPYNFAASFSVGAVGIGISWLFCIQTKESPNVLAPPAEGQYAGRLVDILKRDANFRAYLLCRWLWYLGSMAAGFMAVYAVQHFHLTDATAAIYTGILYAAGVAGYAFWGPLGDRLGNKRTMVASSALWPLALLAALLSNASWGFYLVFALIGFGNAGSVIADLNIAMEFGPEAERPTYIGLTRTTTGPALLIAPLLGGWIAQQWSYPVLFCVSLGLATVGLVLLAWGVKDPRHLPRRAALPPGESEVEFSA